MSTLSFLLLSLFFLHHESLFDSILASKESQVRVSRWGSKLLVGQVYNSMILLVANSSSIGLPCQLRRLWEFPSG